MLALNQIVSSAEALDKEASDFEKIIYDKKSIVARDFCDIAKGIFDTICDSLEIEHFEYCQKSEDLIKMINQYIKNKDKYKLFMHDFVINRNENYLADKIDWRIANAHKGFNLICEFPMSFFNMNTKEITLEIQDLYKKELAEKHQRESELNKEEQLRKRIMDKLTPEEKKFLEEEIEWARDGGG
jgi:hypothetical protein